MTELLPFEKQQFGANFNNKKVHFFALKPKCLQIVNNTKNKLNSDGHLPNA